MNWWGKGSLLEYATNQQKQFYDRLNERIVGQEHVKETLAHTMYVADSQIRSGTIIENARKNLLFVGPPGSGKTYSARVMSSMLNVPMSSCPLTRFSRTGYVGGDFIDSLREYVTAVIGFERLPGNKKSSRRLYEESIAKLHGIMFYDEIDKIVNVENGKEDVIGTVQDEMLDVLQGTTIQVNMGERHSKDIFELDTREMTFICAGAFSGLEKLVAKSIGRHEGTSRNILYEHLTSKHLWEYGIKPELFRRVPNILVFNELGKEDLVNILKNKHSSPLVAKEEILKKLYGVQLIIEPPVYDYVAALAQKDKTLGVGALEQVANALTDLLMRNPKRFSKRRKIVVDMDLAKNFLAAYEKKKMTKKSIGFDQEKKIGMA